MFVSSNITIKNNNFIGTRGAIYSKNSPNVATISHNFIRGTTGVYACSRGIRLASQTPIINSDVSISQNVVVDCSSGIGLNGGDGNFTIVNAKVYNNTIYGSGSNAGIESDGYSRNAEIYNNIIMNTSGSQLRYYTGESMPTISDYNDFYRTSGSLAWNLNYATNYSSIATWRAVTGFDTNSIAANPLFVNAGGSTAADYKRTSYPADGRGGAYSNVMGAYITGNEVIGYVAPMVADIIAPSAPTGLVVN